MPKPFICKLCGYDMERSPRHECVKRHVNSDIENYTCEIIREINNEVVRVVSAESKIEALKLEVYFNATDNRDAFFAEARINGLRID